MRRLGSFLPLLILLFSFLQLPALSAEPPNVKKLLLEVEKGVKEGKGTAELMPLVKRIEEAKAELPFRHLPELNYLLEKEIENLPETKLLAAYRFEYFLVSAKRAFTSLNFVLLFLCFLFFSQQLNFSPPVRNGISVVLLTLLFLTFGFNSVPLVLFLSGAGLTFSVLVGKRISASFLLISSLLFLLVYQVERNVLNYFKNPSVAYSLKLSRDGYSPDYMVDLAYKSPLERKVEKLTNGLALGDLGVSKELNSLLKRAGAPKVKAVILNDLGFISYYRGRYEEALSYFKEAAKLWNVPEFLFNQYLMYSITLNFKEAEAVRKKLEGTEFKVEGLKPIPQLVHLPLPSPGWSLNLSLLFSFIAGAVVMFFVGKVLTVRTFLVEPNLLLVPGMRDFLRDRPYKLLLVPALVFLSNLILGRLLCGA